LAKVGGTFEQASAKLRGAMEAASAADRQKEFASFQVHVAEALDRLGEADRALHHWFDMQFVAGPLYHARDALDACRKRLSEQLHCEACRAGACVEHK
jgi:hypothetical protein